MTRLATRHEIRRRGWCSSTAEFFIQDTQCSPRASMYFSTPSDSCKRCATGGHHVSR